MGDAERGCAVGDDRRRGEGERAADGIVPARAARFGQGGAEATSAREAVRPGEPGQAPGPGDEGPHGCGEGLAALAPRVKVMLVNPASRSTSAFGQGVAELCAGVRDTGSLNAAAKAMGMAYSKAWRVLRDTECALGFALLHRDGARGSVLTPEGTRLVEGYERLCVQLADDAARLYRELVGE